MNKKNILKRVKYLFRFLPDKLYVQLYYFSKMGKFINFKNPQTFNEKIQWIKLYDRKPLYTSLVDKYEVKKYVSDLIGEEYIIPTIGIYDKFEDIDFNKLPKQFVIKCTHDSDGLVIVKDKDKLNIQEAKKKIEKALKYNFYYIGREWPYKNVKPRILIEQYMEDNVDKELRDYKFYCFDGYVKTIMVATNRQSKTEELCFDYFDGDYNHLELTNHWHPNAKNIPHKPTKFEEIKKIAQKLSKGFAHIRADFYEVNGRVYFGEITFFDMSGCLKINPKDWEKEWGDLIKLPEKQKNRNKNM